MFKRPLNAAQSAAALVHPPKPLLCNHDRTFMCPFLAAKSIAYVVQTSSVFNNNHCNNIKWPLRAAQSATVVIIFLLCKIST